MKQNTEPSTWSFLLPSFWIRRLADNSPFVGVTPRRDMFRPPKRVVRTVFLHCSASDNPKHDNVGTIRRWHKARGWRDIGYHYFIRKDGTLEHGRHLEATPAAQKGHNVGTIAICVSGREKFTGPQFATLRALCREIDDELGRVRFRGHCEVSRKACPVFDYRGVLGLDEHGYMVETAANA